jgi:hypothetical protein
VTVTDLYHWLETLDNDVRLINVTSSQIWGKPMATFTGTASPDVFVNTDESDVFHGGAGYDVVDRYATEFRSGSFARDVGNVTFTSGAEIDRFFGIEQIDFIDGRMVFDPEEPVAQVVRLYNAALDRAPEQGGQNFWSALLYQGGTLESLADGFLDSPEFKERFGTDLSDDAFVSRLYQNVLSRAPDDAGAEYWNEQLASGATRSSVLVAFSESEENQAQSAELVRNGLWDRSETAAEVARVYDTAFNRLPDLEGLSFFTVRLDLGETTLKNVVNDFQQSAEYINIYGADSSNDDFVAALYTNTLDRAGAAEEIQFWSDALSSGEMTRADVFIGFSESVEHIALTVANVGGDAPSQYGILFA